MTATFHANPTDFDALKATMIAERAASSPSWNGSA
jgi:hypothetical protein